MPLFNFRLKPTEQIAPWGEQPNQNLHWFALTEGEFYIEVGDERLFSYTQQVMKYWEMDEKYVDYQIASLARSILSIYGAATQPLSKFFTDRFSVWQKFADIIADSKDDDYSYEAFRWFGERSVDTGYFVECPQIAFYRIGGSINIVWDNRSRLIDGVPVWAAVFGVYTISVDDFRRECRDFCGRFLSDMEERINLLASGKIEGQIDVDIKALREVHVEWETELRGYLNDTENVDVSWSEAEKAFKIVVDRISKN